MTPTSQHSRLCAHGGSGTTVVGGMDDGVVPAAKFGTDADAVTGLGGTDARAGMGAGEGAGVGGGGPEGPEAAGVDAVEGDLEAADSSLSGEEVEEGDEEDENDEEDNIEDEDEDEDDAEAPFTSESTCWYTLLR